jgi:hypothetical protein
MLLPRPCLVERHPAPFSPNMGLQLSEKLKKQGKLKFTASLGGEGERGRRKIVPLNSIMNRHVPGVAGTE